MVKISSLEPTTTTEMHSAFRIAFRNYPVPFDLNLRDFERKFIDKLQLDRSLSAGAFEQERLVGFIFQTPGYHSGNKVMYNGGTGVLPEYRGKGLAGKMYDYLQSVCESLGVQYFLLESITHNAPAVKIYRNCGFSIRRLLHCFFLEKDFLPYITSKQKVQFSVPQSIDWQELEALDAGTPAFEEQREQLKRNESLYTMIAARTDNELTGGLLFDRVTGRLAYLSVSKAYRRKGIASGLLRKVAELSYAPVIA
ncbi:MAG: GNAT family N-acetyltransferase, partial [Cyclobacteriaceae bacterium]